MYRLNYIYWYKQQKFISHSVGDWKVQEQGTSRYGVWWELASCFLDGFLLAASLHVRRGKVALWGSFKKGKNFIHEGSTLITKSPPDAITLGVRISICETCRDTNIQYITPGIFCFSISHCRHVSFSTLNLKPHGLKMVAPALTITFFIHSHEKQEK